MEHLDISTSTCEQGFLDGYSRGIQGLFKGYCVYQGEKAVLNVRLNIYASLV